MGVERPLDHGVTGDEEKIRPMRPLRPVPEPALVGRGQVRFAAQIFTRVRGDQFLGLGKVDGWDVYRHARWCDAERR